MNADSPAQGSLRAGKPMGREAYGQGNRRGEAVPVAKKAGLYSQIAPYFPRSLGQPSTFSASQRAYLNPGALAGFLSSSATGRHRTWSLHRRLSLLASTSPSTSRGSWIPRAAEGPPRGQKRQGEMRAVTQSLGLQPACSDQREIPNSQLPTARLCKSARACVSTDSLPRKGVVVVQPLSYFWLCVLWKFSYEIAIQITGFCFVFFNP